MLSVVIQPVLKIMHLLYAIAAFLLTASYHIGRIICLFLIQVCYTVRDIFTVLAIVGEELYQFMCELNTSISAVTNYIQTSANGGINCMIEVCGLFLFHIAKFISNSRIHSKLLATQLGCFICNFFKLLKNALLLIADSTWWLICLVPRWLVYGVIAVGDIIIEIITAIRQTSMCTIKIIVENLFRLTIGIVLLFILWHNRRRICFVTVRWCLKTKRLIKLAFRRLIALGSGLFRRRRPIEIFSSPTRMLRRSSLSQSSLGIGIRDKKPLDASQRCVICRDNQKCVILMPCKHLCLCDDCAKYLFFTMQSRTCPLCRGNVKHSMTVYT